VLLRPAAGQLEGIPHDAVHAAAGEEGRKMHPPQSIIDYIPTILE
jgi:hypothetical protein